LAAPARYRSVRRLLFLLFGLISLAAGVAGIFLPLVPTVPFVLLAAYCFGKSDPRLERWLVEHERFGPHIRAWRRSRAVSMRGKRAAWLAFAASAAIGLLLLPMPWSLVPVAVAAAGSLWIGSLRTEPPHG
jgi:uncharacterized membrane protein YbaN (DUF454 family)